MDESSKPTYIRQESHGANSPNIAGNHNTVFSGPVQVNIDRRISPSAAGIIVRGLTDQPCAVTVGVLGMGGEPEQLANQILLAVSEDGRPAVGVNHGLGFHPFYGVQLRHSTINPPLRAVEAIAKAFASDGLSYVTIPDSGQPAGSIYIYVGFRP